MNGSASYIFTGPEIGERQDAIDAIRQTLKKTTAAGNSLEEHSFYAGEAKTGDILAVLMNASLFAEDRLILIKNAEQIKKKDDVDQLAQYLSKPADNTTLILVSDEISIDKRLENLIPKENKRIFWELFENRKAEWIRSFFKREGFTINQSAIDSILEMVENNTDALRRECSRLVLFLDKSRPIEQNDIERVLSHTREESAFTLFSRLATGDLAKALEVTKTLLAAQENPVQILSGLLWCFRQLGTYQALASSGSLNDFELRKAGIASKKAQKEYADASRRYSAADVENCITLIADYDLTFRSTPAALAATLMDIFICTLVAGKGKPLARIDYAVYRY